jgi:hypothetical protein
MFAVVCCFSFLFIIVVHVTFTKILTIHHSWTHLLHHSPLSPLPPGDFLSSFQELDHNVSNLLFLHLMLSSRSLEFSWFLLILLSLCSFRLISHVHWYILLLPQMFYLAFLGNFYFSYNTFQLQKIHMLFFIISVIHWYWILIIILSCFPLIFLKVVFFSSHNISINVLIFWFDKFYIWSPHKEFLWTAF